MRFTRLRSLIALTRRMPMSARHYLSYTYFLKWTILNKKYYGSRIVNKVEPKKDLLIKYNTSSDPVKRLLKLFGKPDIIRVDKTFTSEQEARDYEYNFLQENNCRLDPTWLNQNDRPAPPIMTGRKLKLSKEQRLNRSLRVKGKNNPMYEKTNEKNHFYGKKHSKESIEKIRNSKKGKSITEKTRQKMRENNKGCKNPNFGKKSPNRRKLIINEIIYNSRKEASIKLEISLPTIYNWLKNGKAKNI